MELKTADNFSMDPNEIVTNRSCIIGQSGSGKSYSVAVICEELLRNQIGFTIIDTEGEYFSLKQKFKIIWVGKDRRCDFDIDEIDMSSFARKVAENRLPIIFDISEVEDPQEKVDEYLTALYKAEDELRNPYLVIVEEADKFIPQRGDKSKIIDEIARRGRKRGLGLMIATQRPSLVDKNILSQCAIPIIGKLTIENDLKAVSIFFNDRKQLLKLPKLNPGEFFVNGTKIKFRKRITQHKASTPKVIPWKFENVKVEKPKAVGVAPKKYNGKLKYIPIHEAKVKILNESLFGKQITEKVIHFNGKKIVKLFPYREIINVEKLATLSKNGLNILLKIKDGDQINDLVKKSKLSETTVRKAIKELEKGGLIISKEEGRIKKYFLTQKFNLKHAFDREINTEEINTKQKKVDYTWVKEFLEKIFDEVESERTFYYPIYEVEKKVLFKNVIIYLDGPTLKKIKIQ